jgi:hypothetical protein
LNFSYDHEGFGSHRETLANANESGLSSLSGELSFA